LWSANSACPFWTTARRKGERKTTFGVSST
jgi:hypothetical protein